MDKEGSGGYTGNITEKEDRLMERNALRERLREQWKRRGLSREELAEALGVSRQAVSKWEGGQSLPDLEKVADLCRLLEISMDWLVFGQGVQGSRSLWRNPKAVTAATVVNLLGLLLRITIYEVFYQEWLALLAVVAVTAVGCGICAAGRSTASEADRKRMDRWFWSVNIWILGVIPGLYLRGFLLRLGVQGMLPELCYLGRCAGVTAEMAGKGRSGTDS
jgi:transcriptional regulator with XRE-family HTH domain